jgi:hypothetical protein
MNEKISLYLKATTNWVVDKYENQVMRGERLRKPPQKLLLEEAMGNIFDEENIYSYEDYSSKRLHTEDFNEIKKEELQEKIISALEWRGYNSTERLKEILGPLYDEADDYNLL